MNAVIIVLIVVVVVVVVALLAMNPVIAKQNDRAILACKDALGGPDRVVLIEPRAVGFASEPEEAGGLRGQGCLALSDADLVFVTTAGQKQFKVARSAITGVDTSGDPRAEAKATVMITYTDPARGDVQASWRVPDPPAWLRELGYDWGDEGPPPVTEA